MALNQSSCNIQAVKSFKNQLVRWFPSIHSFWPFLYHLFKSNTTQRRSRLQHGYCIGVSHRSVHATVGKRLAQGPYMAARAEVEPTTLRLRVIDLANAPPVPTTNIQLIIIHHLVHRIS